MNTNFANIIKQIVSQQGESILANPMRLKVFVRIYAKNEPKEIRLAFGRCIEQGYYRVLKQTSDPEDRQQMKIKIVKQMHNISKLELPICVEAVDILEAVLYDTQPKSQAAPVRFLHLSKKTLIKIAIPVAVFIILIAGWNHWSTATQNYQILIGQLAKQIDGLLSSSSDANKENKTIVPPINYDKNGLTPKDYDRNGWAKLPNGEWVPNPNGKVVYRYIDTQNIATASRLISNAPVNTNTPIRTSQNFASIEETYPLLIRVAENLQYSDINALRDSFNKWKPLPAGYFYTVDERRFYSNQDLFDYKIQKAREWGSKNDQNGDGEINCQDYAELFYKYASDAGYPVRYIVNSGLNHAFNQVRIQNEWVSIEPQSAEEGLNRSPLESVRFPNYNPRYDVIKKENRGSI
jgi:hypothetical protein